MRTAIVWTLLAVATTACRTAPSATPAASSSAPSAAPPAAAPAPPPPAPAKSDDSHVTLVFAASTAGQLVPCGCSPDQRGGLPRAVAYLKKLRAEAPNLLFADGGDLLFESASRPSPESLTQKELKARTLARGEELMGAAGRVVGERDLALGPKLVEETAASVPLLDAGTLPLPSARASVLAKAGPVPVGLFSAGLGENPQATIAARARELRAQGARLVVLLYHPRDNAVSAAQAIVPAARAAGVDLIVVGHRDDPASDPDRKDATTPPVVAVEGHGQSLLRVDATLGKGPLVLARGAADKDAELAALDERIARFRSQAAQAKGARREQLLAKQRELEGRRAAAAAAVEKEPEGATVATISFVPLDSKIPEDPQAKQLVDAYDARVTELNLAEAKTQPERCPRAAKGEAQYVGVHKCAECHQSEAQFWAQTRHAHAYATLVAVKKQFSLDCIRCHVTGWQQPGGVCRIDRTEVGGPGLQAVTATGATFTAGKGRQDVQCEMCHGPGSLHVADPPEHIEAKAPASVCMRCHEAANSPHFDDAKYRPFIVGPGHGAPLAKGQVPAPIPGGPLDALKAPPEKRQ
jgi:hypothetical protein